MAVDVQRRQRKIIADLRAATVASEQRIATARTAYTSAIANAETRDAEERNAANVAQAAVDKQLQRAKDLVTTPPRGVSAQWIAVVEPVSVQTSSQGEPLGHIRERERQATQTVTHLARLILTLEQHRAAVSRRNFVLTVLTIAVVVGGLTTYFWGMKDCGWYYMLRGQESNCVVQARGLTTWARSVSFARNGQYLVASGEDGRVNAWQLTSGEQTLRRRLAWQLGTNPQSDAYNPTVSSSRNELKKPVYGVAFHANRGLVAFGGVDGELWLWNIGSTPTKELSWGSSIWGVAVSPRDDTLAAASEDGTVRIFQRSATQTGNQAANSYREVQQDRHNGPAYTVAFSRDGTMTASGGGDNMVRLRNVSANQMWKELRFGGPVTGVVFTGSGRTVATASQDGAIGLWNVDTDRIGTMRGHNGPVWQVATSPDGTLLASVGEDGAVGLWDVPNARFLRWIGRHSQPATSVAFSPDGQWVAAGSKAGAISVWEIVR